MLSCANQFGFAERRAIPRGHPITMHRSKHQGRAGAVRELPEGNTVFDIVSQITLSTLGLALLIAVIRLVKGPTLPDRVVAMDLVGVLVVGIIVVVAAWTGERATLDAAIVIALVGFVGTVAYGTYVERGDPE